MAEVAVGIDLSTGEARKKKRSSRRGEAGGDEASGERRHRRKKSSVQPGDTEGGGERDGERRKKKKKSREDETPEEKEERRRRRKEKKKAKAEAEAAAAAAAAAASSAAAAGAPAAADSEDSDAGDEALQHASARPPPPPPPSKPPAAAAASDSESDEARGFDEEPPRRQQPPPRAPKPKPKPAPKPQLPPPASPSPPPPPPPPPPSQPQYYAAESDEEDPQVGIADSAERISTPPPPTPPPPPPPAAAEDVDVDEDDDEDEDGYRPPDWGRPRTPTPPATPPPPPPPSQPLLPNPANPADLHRYLAATLDEEGSDAGGVEPESPLHQQPQYPPQQPEPHEVSYGQNPSPFDRPDRPTSSFGGAGDRQSATISLTRGDDPSQQQPPIPEGKKPGGGLLGRLFASFRRGGSTKRKGSTASARKATAAPVAGGAPSTSAESAGLGEHDRWNSNPGLFNANDTPGNTFDQRLQQPVALRQPVPGVRPLADTEVRVILLDGEEISVPIPRKATGSELMARVCEHIDLQEIDYFGLTYVDAKERMWFWLDGEKRVLKQLKHCENRMLNFQVKFYPPEPNMLMADVTRYQLCLQVRQDIYTGKLPCTWVTQALLGSFQVQSELGDFDQAEHGDVGSLDYLQNFEFVHNQTPELVNKIAELHRGHKGITPEVADLRYLETARRLEFYGVDLHPARDLDDVDITIGVCFGGVLVYKDRMRISRFAWPKILRISYRKNLFYLKIRSDLYENVEAVVGFKMMNHRWAKRLWKIAIENHSFFRLKEVQMEKSSSKLSLNFIRGSSSHRYSGRTMHQYRTEGGTMRQSGTFDRSLSKRMSASLPSLKGSHYGSFHSLNRQHPRDMRPLAISGGGGGQNPPRPAGRTASVSVLPTAAFSRDRPSTRSSSTANDDIL